MTRAGEILYCACCPQNTDSRLPVSLEDFPLPRSDLFLRFCFLFRYVPRGRGGPPPLKLRPRCPQPLAKRQSFGKRILSCLALRRSLRPLRASLRWMGSFRSEGPLSSLLCSKYYSIRECRLHTCLPTAERFPLWIQEYRGISSHPSFDTLWRMFSLLTIYSFTSGLSLCPVVGPKPSFFPSTHSHQLIHSSRTSSLCETVRRFPSPS